ncbi:MAG: DUF2782 domain-containing protein [Xanthomonadales bacterium]|jgi:hypothetical protein|nr:DUF2782 domain-containing protein [Xanthomonadales bacterium]MDH3924212.1 DUF2782 domain-containing protein [Xanthomonadales bacterium]MDH3940496.1 DUF2782 domain-containing protein [Xanthomonadales bacterium]MDH4001362.1 DUF2782 domain-containing protein [Xanthomonadales bacterium]
MRNLEFNFMRWTTLAILFSASMMSAGLLLAQEDLEKPPPIPPESTEDVPIPPKVQDEQIEPTVTIREEEERLIEEYRLNGRLYMVKVTPKKGGVPYFYVDTDGDGQLELDADQRAMNPVQPVHWKVLEWD